MSIDDTAMTRAWDVLNTRDAETIAAHFRDLFINRMNGAVENPESAQMLADIDTAAARLAELPDPPTAAFGGYLLLSLAKAESTLATS